MKKTLLFFVAILSSVFAIAQDTLSNQTPWPVPPDVVIKGDDLKNFPGGQLTEMLLGRLPGLDQTDLQNQETKVTFVVDGFVWSNIDAININNIDEIAYYRGGLNSKLSYQNSNPDGVVYITTKTAKFKQPVSIGFNTLLGSNSYKGDETVKKHSMLQSYNVVMSQGLDKFSWRASAVYSKATRNLTGYDFTQQFQLNGALRFAPLKWLDLGLKLNYAPLKGDSPNERIYSDLYYTDEGSKLRQDNWNGTFSAKIQPFKGLMNEIKLLKNNVSLDQDYFGSSTEMATGTNIYNLEGFNDVKMKNLSVINDLNYRFNTAGDRIKFKIGAFFQYNDLKYGYNFRSESYMGETSSYNELSNTLEGQVYSLATDFSVNLYDILSLRAGVRGDNSGSFSKVENFKYSPFYYADLSLKSVFLKNVEAVSEMHLFGSYGQYIFNSVPDDFAADIVASVQGMDKMKAQNFGLKMSFFSNRLNLSGDWYKNDTYTYLNLSVPTTMPSGIPYDMIFPLEYTGWRVWASGDVLKNSKFKWNAGFNIFKNELTIEENSFTQVGNNDLKINKPALQAGIQHSFSYENLFLYVNGYAYFNHPSFTYIANQVNVNPDKATYINLNYLSLGYNFKELTAGKTLKNLKVSFVARNLTHYKKNVSIDPLSKTFGLALNADL